MHAMLLDQIIKLGSFDLLDREKNNFNRFNDEK